VPRTVRVRGNSGIGDAIYTRAVVEFLLRQGDKVTVCSDHPDVYLGLDCKIEPFRRSAVDLHAVYTTRKKFNDTNQWQDVCAVSSLPRDLPLSITWTCRNEALVADLRRGAEGRPLVLVHGGRTPMGRTDGFGRELLPQRRAFEAVLNRMRDCYIVRIGKGADAYPLPVNVDLNGKTSVADILDLGQACDGVVAQCSLAVPLAEAFDKPAMFVWAAAGLQKTSVQFISRIAPAKVLSKSTSAFVLDSWPDAEILAEVDAFRLLL
jgi:hypothetical protein